MAIAQQWEVVFEDTGDALICTRIVADGHPQPTQEEMMVNFDPRTVRSVKFYRELPAHEPDMVFDALSGEMVPRDHLEVLVDGVYRPRPHDCGDKACPGRMAHRRLAGAEDLAAQVRDLTGRVAILEHRIAAIDATSTLTQRGPL